MDQLNVIIRNDRKGNLITPYAFEMNPIVTIDSFKARFKPLHLLQPPVSIFVLDKIQWSVFIKVSKRKGKQAHDRLFRTSFEVNDLQVWLNSSSLMIFKFFINIYILFFNNNLANFKDYLTLFLDEHPDVVWPLSDDMQRELQSTVAKLNESKWLLSKKSRPRTPT